MNATDDVSCSFYNASTKSFDDGGCREVSRTAKALECECDHLTDFAVRVNTPEVGNFEEIKLAGIIYVCTLTGILLVLLPIGWWVDQRRQRAFVDAQFDDALALKHSIEADGADPPPLVRHCGSQRHREPQSLCSVYTTALTTTHPMVVPFFSPPASNFTIPQRLMVLFLVLIGQLFVTGLVFDREWADATRVVVRILLASAIGTPLSLVTVNVVMFWFANTARSPNDARHRRLDERQAALDNESSTNVPFGGFSDVGLHRKQAAVNDTATLIPGLVPAAGVQSTSSSNVHSSSNSCAITVPYGQPPLLSTTSSTNPQVYIGSRVCKRPSPLRRSCGFSLSIDDLASLCTSFGERRHHLAAITLHTLHVANALLATEAAGNGTPFPVSDIAALRAARSFFGFSPDSTAASRMSVRTSGALRPCVMLNVVMEAYLGVSDPGAEPDWPPAPHDKRLNEELYGTDACLRVAHGGGVRQGAGAAARRGALRAALCVGTS